MIGIKIFLKNFFFLFFYGQVDILLTFKSINYICKQSKQKET